MGVPAGLGVGASGLPPTNDQANAVLSGKFIAVGPSQPFAFVGQSNLSLWASYNSALTTTALSLAGSVVSAGAIAAGAAINSTLLPPGTTVGAISGTSITFAPPAVTLQGVLGADGVLSNLISTAGLLGATVTGPGIPAGVTVAAITQVAVTPPSNPGGKPTPGIVQLSSMTTTQQPYTAAQQFMFQPIGNAVLASGTDALATFTGAAIEWTGSVQLERSFDGALTWTVCNIGTGTLAIFNAGTPINVVFPEPERGVLYRLNCTVLSAGNINYRISSTGAAAQSLPTGGNI